MYVNQEGATHCVRWNLVPGQALHSSARDNGSFNPAIAGRNTWYDANAFADPNANVTGSTPYQYGTKPDFQGNDRRFPSQSASISLSVPSYSMPLIDISSETPMVSPMTAPPLEQSEV
jgi:hypothetical protein